MEICKTMLVFFLAVSSTLLSALTASSRNLNEISSVNIKAADEEEDEVIMMDLGGGVLEEKRYDDVEVQGRMDMETINDYSGTSANTHHDPKPPAGSND